MNQGHFSDLFLDNSSDLVWVINNEFHLVYANKAYLKLMKKVTGSEMKLNKPVFVEGFGDGYINKWKEYYTKALDGRYFEIEEHFYNPENNTKEYGQVKFYPILDDDGKTHYVACQSRDITSIVRQISDAKQLMDSSLDTFCTINEAGNFVFVSAASEVLWGYLPEELIGKTYRDLIIEEDLPKTLEIEQAIVNGQEIKSFVNRYKKKDGDIAYNLWSARYDNLTKLTYCVARDAREQIGKEELIRLSEQRFKSLVQEGSDLIGILDQEGNYLYVSPTSTSVLGITPEEFIGKNALEFIHPEDAEKTLAGLQKMAIEKKVKLEPFRFQNKQKEWRWTETVLTNMLDNPSVRGIVANSRDITSKVEEEQKLRLFEKVIDSTTDAIIITEAEPLDEPGPKIVYVNKAFKNQTGYSLNEVIGKNPRFLQGRDSNQKELRKLGEKLRRWEPSDVTVLNYTKYGKEFWVNFVVSPVADQYGWFTHWISVQRDVTEHKNRELEKDLFNQISLCFSNDEDLPTAATQLCKSIYYFGKFDLIELWCPNMEQIELRLIGNYSNDGNSLIHNRSITSFKKNIGLPGKIWKDKKQLLWDEKQIEQYYTRNIEANKLGLKSVLGLPLTFKGEVTGVLLIGTTREPLYLGKYSEILGRMENFIGSEINRKKLEYELKYLYNSIPEVLCVADFNGRFLKINKAGCDLLGYSEEEILYHSFDEFVHPEDKKISSNEISRLTSGARTFLFENRYITKEGKVLWLSWSCHSDITNGLIYASAKNITEEKVLRELNKQASKLSKIGAWEVDLKQSSVYWSEIVHLLHETDPNTFKPDLVSAINFYREEYRPLVKNSIDQCISTGADFDFEAVIVTKGLKERWVRSIGSLEKLNGKPWRIFGSFQDISARKESEIELQKLNESLKNYSLELERSNEELEQFAFVTSHDLQEPLRMISSFMEQLKIKYGDQLDDKANQYIHYALDGARRMKQIILDLLLYSRANKPTEELEEVDLNGVLNDYKQLRRKVLSEKSVVLDFNELPTIRVHKAPITQIFHCLIDNAIKYSKEDEPPTIKILAEEKPNEWEFSIEDNGIGIEPQFFEKIFGVFQRLHNRERYEGTGIGLAVVKRSVEFLGGRIWLTSELGMGSTFYFTIKKNNPCP